MKPNLNNLTFEERKKSRENFLNNNHYHNNYAMDERGTFLIKGEDTSGSYSVSHCPILAVFYGTFSDAIDYAVTLEGWSCWTRTSSGSIEKIPSNLE